jgi:hypothetical protein
MEFLVIIAVIAVGGYISHLRHQSDAQKKVIVKSISSRINVFLKDNPQYSRGGFYHSGTEIPDYVIFTEYEDGSKGLHTTDKVGSDGLRNHWKQIEFLEKTIKSGSLRRYRVFEADRFAVGPINDPFG